LKDYVKNFKKEHPRSQIEYQGVLRIPFRDFLINQSDVKPLIEKDMKEGGLFSSGENKHKKVYDFVEDFYNENGRGPSTTELYQTFLNFNSHELRGKMNVIRNNNPEYYSKPNNMDKSDNTIFKK